jgi:hypothetical protein
MEHKLIKQTITLNGVKISVQHSSKVKVPKVLNSSVKATGNVSWRRLANKCLKI